MPSTPLIVFAGGGTGGHLYPAIAVKQALKDHFPELRFAFLVTERSIDRRILENIEGEVVPQSLPALTSRPWQWPGALRVFRRARLDCRLRFLRDPPALVIGSGGMSSVPGVLEAHRAGIPTALLNPDAIPGRANRYLGSRADAVFAQFDDTADWFRRKKNVLVTGCPVRLAFHSASRQRGVDRFGLDPRKKTLLVTGASLGARSVNEAVVALLPHLAQIEDWQILHLTGAADFESVRTAYGNGMAAGKVVAYTDDMADALAAADLVISRSGASTLAELTAVGRASVLMPYPHHRDQHQLANARCLARSGAARIVADSVDTGQNASSLRAAFDELLRDDGARERMAAAARRIGQGNAASRISAIIFARFLTPLAATIETVEPSL